MSPAEDHTTTISAAVTTSSASNGGSNIKIHECSIFHKSFPARQALGRHKAMFGVVTMKGCRCRKQRHKAL
ncbi:hypothetical protein L195_g056744 [Trifolium pratense]|uniref:Uncharacterized protein n=1 Tax=Trifolium pratense TaxID=57577 RepID=A0A2K3KT82_TRIPR|nr:hypothetical protein L195_g056744 [Trifolium pratense]